MGTPLEELRDSVLVERLRAGDRDAALVLWRRHAPDNRTALMSVLNEPERVDTTLRRGFNRVVDEIRNNDDPLAPFALHLRTTVLLEAFLSEAESPTTSPILTAFSRLSRMDQTILWASLVEKTPDEEIAKRTWFKADDAPKLVRRAESRLLETWLRTLRERPLESSMCDWVIQRARLGRRNLLRETSQQRFTRHVEQCSQCQKMIEDYARFPSNLLHDLRPIPFTAKTAPATTSSPQL